LDGETLMATIPIMFVGDAPDTTSGLGRILRDLATVLTSSPHYRVSTLGYAGVGSVKLPFTQYQMTWTPDPVQSLQLSLERAFEDFTRGEQGIVMTVWDPSRLHWLAQPAMIEHDLRLRDWLLHVRTIHRMILWGYIPVDSEGPHGRLTAMTHDTLLGYDRLLAYTKFGEDLILSTIGPEQAAIRGLSWLPHAIGEVFK
jgi:hypothetical protein